MTLLVVFGSTPDLAWQELITLFPSAERISSHTAAIHDARIDPLELNKRLGGATKIGRLISVVPALDAETLTPILSTVGFRSFGISSIDVPPVSAELLGHIKEKLARPARFLSGQLSAVVITKQHVTEFLVFPYRGKFGVALTLVVQDFEGWTKRDRARPHADSKAGMLPPKVARMMVNIADSALSSRPPSRDPVEGEDGFRVKPGMTKKTLFDPFCGMGTILGEALLIGWQVVGSDYSREVIQKAEANLSWLIPSKKTWRLLVSDATHVSKVVEKESIDAIVTEPFMGKPNVSEKNVRDVTRGLEKLYIGSLKDWRGPLKPGGKVIIVLPQFRVGGKSYFVKKAIDSCETLGYTVLVGPIEYARATAVVRRQIYIFQKKSSI